MGKIKLFPTAGSAQPSESVVPLVPCTGIFLGPSKSGKTVALISMILENGRGLGPLSSSRERIIFAGECLWEFFFSLSREGSSLRDGSYRLQPGERLSWEQEIPETDLIASSPAPLLGARNPRDGSYRLQPGERLSWEQEIPKTDLIASNLVSASPGSKKSPRRILSPPAR